MNGAFLCDDADDNKDDDAYNNYKETNKDCHTEDRHDEDKPNKYNHSKHHHNTDNHDRYSIFVLLFIAHIDRLRSLPYAGFLQ